jgi:isopropylmalate/homocitrate/citramalate synthase
MNVEILDSTLRDGAQGEGISFSVQDKIHICQALDDLGIGLIEAGNPGSNPKDMEFFQEMKKFSLRILSLQLLVLHAERILNVQKTLIFRVFWLPALNTLSFLEKAGHSRLQTSLKQLLKKILP